MEHHLILGQNPSASTSSIPKQSMMMVKEETTQTETGLLLSNDNDKVCDVFFLGRNKVCDVCGKGFGNAKALHGHMRVHFHPRCNFNASNPGEGEFSPKHGSGVRRLKIKRKVSSSDDQRGRVVVVVGSEVCPVCGKGFGSEKALYGHMRCHSGRGWRGMLPPTTPPLTASTRRANVELSLSHSDDDHDDRLSQKSSGDSIRASSSDLSWSRKGKRGRDPVQKLSKKGHGFGGDVDLMMWDAAEKLLELGQNRADPEDTSSSSMEAKRRRLIRNALLPSDSEFGKSWFEEFDEYIREKRRRKAIFLNSVKPEWDSDDEYYLNDLLPVGWDTDFDIRVDHHRELFDPSAGLSPSWLCSSSAHVSKLISSKNHHKKLATMKKFDPQLHDQSAVRSPEGPAATSDASDSAEDDEEEEETHPAGVFKCRHCPKTFATGQALGGHQRAHYVPGGVATMLETAPTSTWSQDDQDSDSSGRKRLLLFDLNEPATNEEEADEADQ